MALGREKPKLVQGGLFDQNNNVPFFPPVVRDIGTETEDIKPAKKKTEPLLPEVRKANSMKTKRLPGVLGVSHVKDND